MFFLSVGDMISQIQSFSGLDYSRLQRWFDFLTDSCWFFYSRYSFFLNEFKLLESSSSYEFKSLVCDLCNQKINDWLCDKNIRVNSYSNLKIILQSFHNDVKWRLRNYPVLIFYAKAYTVTGENFLWFHSDSWWFILVSHVFTQTYLLKTEFKIWISLKSPFPIMNSCLNMYPVLRLVSISWDGLQKYL